MKNVSGRWYFQQVYQQRRNRTKKSIFTCTDDTFLYPLSKALNHNRVWNTHRKLVCFEHHHSGRNFFLLPALNYLKKLGSPSLASFGRVTGDIIQRRNQVIEKCQTLLASIILRFNNGLCDYNSNVIYHNYSRLHAM